MILLTHLWSHEILSKDSPFYANSLNAKWIYYCSLFFSSIIISLPISSTKEPSITANVSIFLNPFPNNRLHFWSPLGFFTSVLVCILKLWSHRSGQQPKYAGNHECRRPLHGPGLKTIQTKAGSPDPPYSLAGFSSLEITAIKQSSAESTTI